MAGGGPTGYRLGTAGRGSVTLGFQQPVRKVAVGQEMVYPGELQGAKHSHARRYCEHVQRGRPLQLKNRS